MFIFEKQIGYPHVLRKKHHLESCVLLVDNNMLHHGNSCSKLICMQYNPQYYIVFLSSEILCGIYMIVQQVHDMSSLIFQKRMTWLEKFLRGLLLLTDLMLLAVKFHYLVLNRQLPFWNIHFLLLGVMFIHTASGLVSSSYFLLHPYYSSDWISKVHLWSFLWFGSALRRIMT